VIRRFHPVLASLTVGLVAFIAVVGFYWWW